MTYEQYLASKRAVAPQSGMAPPELSDCLKPHQRMICEWALRGGNRAVFADFGLGKTIIQLQLMRAITSQRPGRALIVAPLGVKGEFVRDAKRFFDMDLRYVRTDAEVAAGDDRIVITNYERVRDGQITPAQFEAVTLDEASCLRSYGSKTFQEFLTLFPSVPVKFVCTATPAPNRFKELIHYSAFLGIMDSGQALTRFFQRDSTKAGNLTLYPHMEEAFWHWVASWACFVTKPSDLGCSDDGYVLPPLQVVEHRLPVDHTDAGVDSWGQGRLLRDAAFGVAEASAEKRDSIEARIAQAKAIIDAAPPSEHWIIWHDLESERRAIERAFPEAVTVYGSQDLEEREQAIADFSDGKIRILATKPIIAGSGCNFQRYCHRAIYLGIGYKFNDFFQSLHRLHRFLQPHQVEAHIIYTESEDGIYDELKRKWAQHHELRNKMSSIIQQYGLDDALTGGLERAMGCDRVEVAGETWTAVNNDNVFEMRRLADDSVDLIVTSWPFSDQYEYCASYNDFGHNDGDDAFFAQMDYLTPEVLRALKPGRLYCVHAKDRIVFGSVSGDGMYTVNEFSDKCVAHLKRHGLKYMGRITVVTDVVRENNQTYRLGWTENSKDGTKMGVGMPEYVLLFRKLPSDTTRAYADEPVKHDKGSYTRGRWQFDAHSLWRSSGERFLSPEEARSLDFKVLRKLWHEYNGTHVYDFQEHVALAEGLEASGFLPSSFMLLDPVSPDQTWVWDDVTRMKTLNSSQAQRRQMVHTCPLQLDIVERLIERYSNPGDLVLDPFGGIGTVAYCAVRAGRRGYTIELSPEYHADAVAYLRAADAQRPMPTLFGVS